MKKAAKLEKVFHTGLQCNFRTLKQAIQAYFTFPLCFRNSWIYIFFYFLDITLQLQNNVREKLYFYSQFSGLCSHQFGGEGKQIEVDVLLNCFFLQPQKSLFTLFSTTLNSFLESLSLERYLIYHFLVYTLYSILCLESNILTLHKVDIRFQTHLSWQVNKFKILNARALKS